jgi:competence protein ComEC
MTADHRVRRLIAAAIGCCGGAAALLLHPVAWPLPASMLGVVGLIGFGRRGRGRRSGRAKHFAELAAWLVGGLALGGASACWHADALRTGPVAALAATGAVAAAEFRVTRDPVPIVTAGGATMWLIDATTAEVAAPSGVIVVTKPVLLFGFSRLWQDADPGQLVVAEGRWQRPRPSDSVAAVVDVETSPRLIGRPPWWQRWAQTVRSRLAAACAGLPIDERTLEPALVLGVVEPMPVDLKRQFQITGLSHLVAVSGENLAIVFIALTWLVRRVGLRRWARALVLAAAVVAFVAIARPSPSVLRAAAMGMLAVLAMISGRPGRSLPSLAVAVAVLVAFDPWLVRDLGFGLSVCATTGLLILGPPLRRRMQRRLPGPVALAVSVPLAAQLACTPLLLLSFGQLTPWSVPANLVAGLAVPAATLLGLAVAVVALVLPVVAGWLSHLAAAPAWWIVQVARTFARLPGSAATVPPGAALGIAAVMVAATISVASWAAWRPPP